MTSYVTRILSSCPEYRIFISRAFVMSVIATAMAKRRSKILDFSLVGAYFTCGEGLALQKQVLTLGTRPFSKPYFKYFWASYTQPHRLALPSVVPQHDTPDTALTHHKHRRVLNPGPSSEPIPHQDHSRPLHHVRLVSPAIAADLLALSSPFPTVPSSAREMAPTLSLDTSRRDPFTTISSNSPPPNSASKPPDKESDSALQRRTSYCDVSPLNQFPRYVYTPPVNFGMVTHRLYRSSFPQKENFPYLRRLKLKSVLYDPPSPFRRSPPS